MTIHDSPKVSVIISFLNAQKFLREAVESVFAQTFDDWELLLVDDGSTDGSSDIALEYVGQHGCKVCYWEHEGHKNRGISASRNLGIAQSHGEYIALLDADDVWLPNKLEEQVAALKAHPEVGMVWGASQYWRSWDRGDRAKDKIVRSDLPSETVFYPPDLLMLCYPLGRISSPCPSSLLFRKELAGRVGGFEAQMPNLYDDQGFLVKVYLASPVFVAGRCWSKYRLHEDSCCAVAQKNGLCRSARQTFFRWFSEYLERNSIQDPRIWKALNRALRRDRHPGFYWAIRKMERVSRFVVGFN